MKKLPDDFDLKDKVKKILIAMEAVGNGDMVSKDKKLPRPPLNVFLEQELYRIQKVLSLVKSTLKDLDQAI